MRMHFQPRDGDEAAAVPAAVLPGRLHRQRVLPGRPSRPRPGRRRSVSEELGLMHHACGDMSNNESFLFSWFGQLHDDDDWVDADGCNDVFPETKFNEKQ